MKRILLVFSALYLSIIVSSFSQSVPFPPEPQYNTLSAWGYTQAGTTWNTSPYLPFKYQGIWFRMMLPNGVTYNASTNTFTNSNPSVKYPMIVFNPGAGERGLDNNKQLLHGGQVHMQAVQSGRFPGFLVYWQTESGFLEADKLLPILNKLFEVLPVDIDRVYTHGLSRGGKNTWDLLRDIPKVFAAAFPMSAAAGTFYHDQQVHIPVRLAQGGLDTNPTPDEGQDLVDEYAEHGGNLEYYFFPTLGHGTWNTCYALPDFFEWFLKQRKNQIHVFFNDPLVCPGDPISKRLGMTGGFDGYQWMKDGVVLPNTTNEITATAFGSYQARFRRGSVWTGWSAPVVIGEKPPTQTPPITTNGLKSIVLPAPDGSTTVPLQLPTGYGTYRWFNAAHAVIGTARTITLPVGVYTANVEAVGGCSSIDSPPFTVIDANGPNGPDPINNLRIVPQGLTSLVLNWENNPTPINNETGFEIYRAENPGGPYTLVKINGADQLSYVDPGLISSKSYSYILRAVNNTGASAASDVVTAMTGLDEIAPNVPQSLTVTAFTPTSVTLRWNTTTDNVGVVGYDIYANGVKAYTATGTGSTITFTVSGLITNTLYNFVVRARDAAGNSSSPSNQVTQNTTGSGLNYKFFVGSWTAVPNFDALSPSKIGWLANFAITPRTQTDNFGFQYTGKLRITNPGNYTFYTRSDDGSKLYLNGVLIVNNDGLHGQVEVASAVQMNLAAGIYDLKVDYFDATGGDGITVSWSRQGNNPSKQNIPNDALTNVFTPPTSPAVPAGLTVTTVDHQALNVTWTAYAGTGTTIEIQRSSSQNTGYNTIMSVPKSQSTWINSGLQPNTRYYYRIRAVGPTGESAYTSTNPAKTAVTLPLPPIPSAPTNLVLQSVGSNTDSIRWTDNSNNETTFEIQKSVGNNSLFQIIGSVPGSAGAAGAYRDLGLFAHTTYFYRVRARNVGGASGFSNQMQVNTVNSVPVISPLDSFALRFDEVKIFPITASDADGDAVFIEGVNLPEFVNLFDYGDGTAELFIEPTEADAGVYSNLQIKVIDGFGGVATTTFSFEVNDNHSPTIAPPAAISLKETYVVKSVILANDADGDPITWELTNAPSFMTFQPNAAGDSLKITLKPEEVHAGNYTVGLKVKDPSDNYSLGELQIQVQEFNPSFVVSLNFGLNNSNASTPWNNITFAAAPPAGATFSNLVNQSSATTSLGITLVTDWDQSQGTGGVPTNFSGLYPNTVMRSFINTVATPASPEVIRITGLNPNNKYNFDLLAARNTTGNRNTLFQMNGTSITVDAGFNTTVLAEFNNVVPNANGEIELRVSAAAGAASGSLNAMIIESFYDGTLPPAAPTNFAVGYSDNSDVRMTWDDNSGTEFGFEIFRSTDAVSFTKIYTTQKNIINHDDLTAAPFTTYYYTLRAFNGNGYSNFTDTLSIDGLNKSPIIAPVPLITVGEGQSKNVIFTATDPEGGYVTMFLDGAPPFVSLVGNGSGVATMTLAPPQGSTGTYAFDLIAMDDYGYTGAFTVNVSVSDFTETFVLVNFTRTGSPVPATNLNWNNYFAPATGAPSPLTLSNMKDNTGVATTIDIATSSAAPWGGASNINGDPNGILYPSQVTNTFLFYQGGNRTITLTGLKPEQLYDLEFFGSRSALGTVTPVKYAVTSPVQATLKEGQHDVNDNSTRKTNLVGVKSDASGQIVITVSRINTSGYIYINAMVIREYTDNGLPTAPTNLTANVSSRSSIGLTWVDQSSNENGFEIWRSVGDNAHYSLWTTTAANAQSYTNTGLNQDTQYFYKIRAKIDNTTFSAYTAETSGRTFVSSVSINFAAVAPLAPAPWNNISNFLATPGDRFSGLIDDQGISTNLSLLVIEPFVGDNQYGMTTGNNSGVVPDDVMLGAWWNDGGGVQAVIRIEGLSFLNTYNFGFFPSRNGGGNRNTTYTIGSKSVTVNAAYNISTIGQIKDLVPDVNGGITFTVKGAENSTFAYLNALIIQAATASSPPPLAKDPEAARVAQISETENDIVVHPNPFTNHVTITVESQKEIAQVALLTANGSTVYSEMEVKESSREHYVDFTNVNLNSGMYYMKVKFKDGSNRTIKLLRK